jgi:4-amino-4-deoxy-L-arabinose transferase-like glycosyltransferase
MSSFKENRNLILVLLLALVLRALMLIIAIQHPERAFLPDTSTYIEAALKILNSGVYPESAWRTPVYPLFIAMLYAVAGQHTLAVIAAQVLISTASVALTYWLGVRLMPKPAALTGAFLMATSVESVTHAFFLLTETLFTFLLLASMLAFVKFWQEKGGGWLVFSAILIALATLCRPIVLYFPLLIAVLIFFGLHADWRQRFRTGLIYLFIFAVTLGPWVARNYFVIGLPTVSTISNYNLLIYNAASLEANLNGASEEETRPQLQDQAQNLLASYGWEDTEANRARVQSQLARQIILAHPFRYLYVHLKSDLNNFLPDVTGLTEILGLTVGGKGTLSVLNQQGLAAAVSHYFEGNTWLLWLFFPLIALLGLTYLAGLAGALALTRQRAWFSLGVLLLPTIYLLLIPGAPSLPRFRVPVMPYLCLLAGLGVNVAYHYFYAKFSSLRKFD